MSSYLESYSRLLPVPRLGCVLTIDITASAGGVPSDPGDSLMWAPRRGSQQMGASLVSVDDSFQFPTYLLGDPLHNFVDVDARTLGQGIQFVYVGGVIDVRMSLGPQCPHW